MKFIKKIITAAKVIYYLLRLAIIPKKSLMALLKLGNIVSETQAFTKASETVLRSKAARKLVTQRYGPGIPSIDVLLEYPIGSLGHALGKFMHDQGLDQYPFPIQQTYTTTEYLRERRRQLHDILHVVLEYDTSLEGEAKVNAFVCGQGAFPIPVIISAGVLLLSIFKFPRRLGFIYADQVEAYSRGQNSPSIFGIKWEKMWHRPIEEVRAIFLSKDVETKQLLSYFERAAS